MAIEKVFRGAASDGDSMRSLSRMLLGIEGVYLKALTSGVREAANFAIKWGQIIVDDGWLRLSSDLHKLFLYCEVYRNNESTSGSITEGGLYRFIDRVIERLDPCQLEKSKARNANETKLYESQYQNEFYRAARSILPRNSCMSSNVGPLFGVTSYLDYYLHPQRWGFELLVDGSNLKGHKARFQSQGVYHKLIEDKVISEYAILDFRTKPLVLPSPDVLHIVFSKDFGKATLHRFGSVPNSLDIRGSV